MACKEVVTIQKIKENKNFYLPSKFKESFSVSWEIASERKVRLQRQTSTRRSDLCPAVLHSGLGNFAPDKDLGF